MKLNPDCLRAVMLEVEKSWSVSINDRGYIQMDSIQIENLYESIDDFEKQDIFYSVYNLEQVGYLDVTFSRADGGVMYDCTINYMTFKGHEFLNSIRDEDNWKGIKKGLNAIRNYSLDAISAVANGIASAGISAFIKSLNLPDPN